jgi:hypothetical protein
MTALARTAVVDARQVSAETQGTGPVARWVVSRMRIVPEAWPASGHDPPPLLL